MTGDRRRVPRRGGDGTSRGGLGNGRRRIQSDADGSNGAAVNGKLVGAEPPRGATSLSTVATETRSSEAM